MIINNIANHFSAKKEAWGLGNYRLVKDEGEFHAPCHVFNFFAEF